MQKADGKRQKAANAKAQTGHLPSAKPTQLPQIIGLPKNLHSCIFIFNGDDFLGISLLKDLRHWGELEYSRLKEIVLENADYGTVFLARHFGIVPNKINLSNVVFCETGIIADLDTPADILEIIVQESRDKGFNFCILDIYRDRYSPIEDLLSDETYGCDLTRGGITEIIQKYPAHLGFSDISVDDISLLPSELLGKTIYMFENISVKEVGQI